jgi:hypothetical protein
LTIVGRVSEAGRLWRLRLRDGANQACDSQNTSSAGYIHEFGHLILQYAKSNAMNPDFTRPLYPFSASKSNRPLTPRLAVNFFPSFNSHGTGLKGNGHFACGRRLYFSRSAEFLRIARFVSTSTGRDHAGAKSLCHGNCGLKSIVDAMPLRHWRPKLVRNHHPQTVPSP